jgi:hypothetical protein
MTPTDPTLPDDLDDVGSDEFDPEEEVFDADYAFGAMGYLDPEPRSKTLMIALSCVAAILLVPAVFVFTSSRTATYQPTAGLPVSTTPPRHVTTTTVRKHVRPAIPKKAVVVVVPVPTTPPTTAPVQVVQARPAPRRVAQTPVSIAQAPVTQPPTTQPHGVAVPYSPPTQPTNNTVAVPVNPTNPSGP